MSNLSFAAQVEDWVRRVKGAEEQVFKESAQALVAEAQKERGDGGRMRVDTGFLRASLMASTSAMPPINPSSVPPKDAEKRSIPFVFGPIEAVIAGSELGDTLYFGWTAAYAGHREYGTNGQPADAFVRTAAQKWPMIVQTTTAELKARLGL